MEVYSKEEILAQIPENPSSLPFLIAIDGPCGSGKSTLGQWLSRQLSCPLLHMDDFYLQKEQRTDERLQETGGNVDYERFYEEVVQPLKTGREVSYTPLLCPHLCFGPSQTLQVKKFAVIEGSYAFHPYFQDPWNLKIFVCTDKNSQRSRILQRSSQEKLKEFETRWIPREEAYFQEFQIRQQADLIFKT